MRRRRAWTAAILSLLLPVPACHGDAGRDGAGVTLRMLVPANERPFWLPLAESFSRARPGVRLELDEGPVPTDLRESLTTSALLSGDGAFDVVYLDVTWTPKLAAAGWLRPLDDDFGEAERAELLPQAVQAGFYRGRLYRLPFRTDVGLLYYRADLLAAAGVAPPRTFAQLEETARRLQSPPDRWGFLWQGAQYEGLVCVFLEVLHGHGGFWIEPASLRVGLDRPEAEAALAFLVRARAPGGISPPGVAAYSSSRPWSMRTGQGGGACPSMCASWRACGRRASWNRNPTISCRLITVRCWCRRCRRVRPSLPRSGRCWAIAMWRSPPRRTASMCR